MPLTKQMNVGLAFEFPAVLYNKTSSKSNYFYKTRILIKTDWSDVLFEIQSNNFFMYVSSSDWKPIRYSVPVN